MNCEEIAGRGVRDEAKHMFRLYSAENDRPDGAPLTPLAGRQPSKQSNKGGDPDETKQKIA
jgi:hypothetical protein